MPWKAAQMPAGGKHCRPRGHLVCVLSALNWCAAARAAQATEAPDRFREVQRPGK